MNQDSRVATDADLAMVEKQLGRSPRDVHAISYRCPCGKPAVVETPPRLSDGDVYKRQDDYIAARSALKIDVPEIENISAGGMPNRVKCLHALIAHSLSAGPGVNPLGDEALAELPQWWKHLSCE